MHHTLYRFLKSMDTVSGPTPPGTGVIKLALSAA